eukprot:m.919388 g.919388  ORF g.919388 m.919388 type:complete len:735 (+) comp23751_c0_seq2:288-2492(+)
MFWKFGFTTPSNIDNILQQENFTLQELLDDDDILSECRNQNKKLTDYLSQPENIRTLLEYVVNEPSDGDDERTRFKYPNIAAEVLTSECWPIMDAMCKPEPMDLLWTTLDRPAPLNPLLASFFTKIVVMLLGKEVKAVSSYFFEHPDIADKLISHLGTPSIMDVIMKMTSIEMNDGDDDDSGSNDMAEFWSRDGHLVGILVGLFDTANSGASDQVLYNAAILMEDLVVAGRKEAIEMQEYSHPSPYLQQLTSVEMLNELLTHILAEGTLPKAREYGLNLINVLLQETERGEEEAPPTDMDKERYEKEVQLILKALTPRLSDMHGLLTSCVPEGLVTASGNLKHALGSTRLSVIATIVAFVTKNDAEVDAQIQSLGTIPILLELFEQLPHNNFLHAHVCTIVEHILMNPTSISDGPLRPLHEHLFKECNLVDKIIEWYKSSLVRVGEMKERAGYHGHLLRMANCIDALKKDASPVAQYFAGTDVESNWNTFVAELLKPENDRLSDGMFAKPMHSMIDSDDDSDDNIYEPNQAVEAERAFQRYLNQRINVDLPDDYGVDDSDDSDDDDSFVYGTSVGFSATSEYSTDLGTAQNGVTFQGDWSMDHPSAGMGSAVNTDLSATVTLGSAPAQRASSDDDEDDGYLQVNGTEEDGGSSEEEGEAAVEQDSGADTDTDANRPPALDTREIGDAFSAPDGTSTPRDGPADLDWANFGGGNDAVKDNAAADAATDSVEATTA